MSPKYAHSAEYRPLASLSNCEVRSVIQFLRACGETTAEIHRQILAVYGEECHMRKSMAYRYFAGKRFDITEEIKAAVVEYFQNLDAEYCRAGLQKLNKQYTKSLDLQGYYVEK